MEKKKDVLQLSDRELVQKMREENYERFKALVRMHLSFELDMNMDEFDLPCHEIIYYEKGKMKKWSRLTKKIKSCTSYGKYNSPVEEGTIHLTVDLVHQLRRLKEVLTSEENVKQEGIFRLTGSISRQNELKNLINSNKLTDLKGFTVNDCATVFKNVLANLPEPLLTDAHYSAHCQIAELCNNIENNSSCNKETHILHSVQLLLLLLPEENRILFEDIIEMLNKILMQREFNKMSADNLATLFSPHLICPRNLPPEALYYISQNTSKIISYMITKGPLIFEIPPKLMTDIRAYFLEQKRRKTMSPERTLDESTSDLSTVNTVYTFVDREKTAAANNSDPTDTALAQLYAHIQSLPESSKKRKLIRQFNKENGQGTPLQFLLMNRMKNEGSSRSAKSISDSIKKHIFHKGIICRTPKRSNPSTNSGTPNTTNKNTKSRVLFQSPSSTPNTNNINFSTKRHRLHKSISSTSLLTNPSKLELEKSSNPCVLTSISKACDEKNSVTVLNQIKEKSPEENKSSMEKVDDGINSSSQEDLIIEKPQMKIMLKSKFKSEPNLNRILYDDHDTDSLMKDSVSLVKRNSMSNIRLEFDYSKKNHYHQEIFLEEKKSFLGSVVNVLGSPYTAGIENISEQICRSKNLITSTPSILLGRRSMSPITKSTQRMSKSMQESIMTPRSRKPVMLTTTLGSSERNHTTCQSDLSGFREEDEDSFLLACSTSVTKEGVADECQKNKIKGKPNISTSDSLTNTFREYLLSRKVLTTSPEDSSFSSHSDDFGSAPDIHNFSEENISESLLYCLDGNKPFNNPDQSFEDEEKHEGSTSSVINRISRKRPILNNENDDDDKENYYENHLEEKKILVIQETINETSI